jgi:nucleotide-binding universal stress UspA family protein
MKFSKIMVAIDGSDTSIDALNYAISISKEYNADLCAVYVVHTDIDLFGPHASSEYTIKMKKEGQEYLDKAKLKAEEKNMEITTEIISSTNISAGIAKYAEEKNFDLIVVGTRGLSGLKRILLGSVASKIIAYAHCPVMIIK